jgi:hypothetical protein
MFQLGLFLEHDICFESHEVFGKGYVIPSLNMRTNTLMYVLNKTMGNRGCYSLHLDFGRVCRVPWAQS